MHYKRTLNNFAPEEFAGRYDFPKVKGIRIRDLDSIDMIGFNYATQPNLEKNQYIHFYLGDYKIEKVWKLPDKYLKILSRFRGIVQPDFSVYTNMPRALQIYNYYRNMWVAAYAQKQGIKVIPSTTWGGEDTFDWYFDGMPKRSCICTSNVGCIRNKANRELFVTGLEAMVDILKPVQLIIYGRKMPEIDSIYHGEIKYIKDDMRKRIENYLY